MSGVDQPPRNLAERVEQSRLRALDVLGSGEPPEVVALCSKGFIDHTFDAGGALLGSLRPSNLLAEALGGSGVPDESDYRTPVNPGSGGPPQALGPTLDACLPTDFQHLVVAVTPTRLALLTPRRQPAQPLAERARSAARSLARGVRDLVVNRTEIRPVGPLEVRWACRRDAVQRALVDAPSRAGFLRVVVVFVDASWCVLSPIDQATQSVLVTALAGRGRQVSR